MGRVGIDRPYYYTGVWTVGLACALTAAVHWRLAAHAPTLPPDIVAPATIPVFVQSPLLQGVDALNALAVRPDVALASWLVVAAVAGVTTAWARRLDVPRWLAIAVGVGVTFLPHTWSTQAAGRDALVLLGMLAAAAWLSSPRAERPSVGRDLLPAAAALVLVAHHPPTFWWLAPLVPTMGRLTARRGAGWVLAAAVTGMGATLFYAQGASAGLPCVGDGPGPGASLWTVLRPGVTADVALTGRVSTAAHAVVSDLHAFGLIAAAWALWLEGRTSPALRRFTSAAMASVVAGVLLGTLTPRLVVLAATVAWVPWFALACRRLLTLAPSRPLLAAAVVGWVAVGLPLARHAVFVPGPLATAAPAVWAAAYTRMDGAVVAVSAEDDARRARRSGASILAAQAGAVAACLSGGTPVMAVGPALETLRHDGVVVDDVPVTIPLVALAGDLRPGAVVALAVTVDGARWLPPADVVKVTSLGASDAAWRRRSAQAIASELPAAPSPDTDTNVASLTATAHLDVVGSRRLWHPISVDAQPGAVSIASGASPAQPVVLGNTAAIAVFDRTERPVIRASAVPMPGLPIPLYSTLPALRMGRVIEVAADRARPGARPLLPAELPPTVDADTAATRAVHVGDGWHDAEAAGRLAFRWSASPEATAVFRLDAPAPLAITLSASPAQTATHANALHLSVNGVPVAHGIDGSRSIDVPASVTRAGTNTLTFVTDSVIPAGTIPGEPRTLAAVVRELRVVPR